MHIKFWIKKHRGHPVFMTQSHLQSCELELTDDNTGDWHLLSGNLEPSARGGTEVNANTRRLQKLILAIQLQQLKCSSRSVT